MEFTETQLEILCRAWALNAKGSGQVLEPEMYPEACRLEDAGWLERRYVDATGDWAWFWTPEAETALDLNALRETAMGSTN
jgi:hypothetical protein